MKIATGIFLIPLISTSIITGKHNKERTDPVKHVHVDPSGAVVSGTDGLPFDGPEREFAHRGYIKEYGFVSGSSIRINSMTRSLIAKSTRSQKSMSKLFGTDSFLLEFDGYGYRFCFHMHPNYDLFHPNMAANMVDQDGNRMQSISMQHKLPFRGYLMDYMNLNETDSDLNIEYECRWNTDNPSFENYGDTYGWARFIFHNDQPSSHAAGVPRFEGVFMLGDEIFNVKSIESYQLTRRPKDAAVMRQDNEKHYDLMVFRMSDMKGAQSEHFCGSGDKTPGWDHEQAASFYRSRAEVMFKYGTTPAAPIQTTGSNPKLSKRVYTGCPQTKQIIYMGAVADCTYYQVYGSDEKAVQAQIISNWNTASAIYESYFNIFLGLIDIQIMKTCSSRSSTTNFNVPCSTQSYNISNRLSDFAKWRDTLDNSAGLWHLMSNCSTGPTIGIAWLNMVCQTKSFSQTNSDGSTSYVSGVAVSTASQTEFLTVAHEIGHNFGAIHDCTSSLCVGCTTDPCSQCCPCTDQCDCQNAFIMNPTSNVNPNNPKFSPCTQTYVCKNNKLFGTCLESPGQRAALNSGICGNGIKEGTEQCDCGGVTECATDACCFSNCTLKAGAVCADKNYPCCKNCQIIPANTSVVCRPSSGECDIPESCMGDAACPTDMFKPDGISCGNTTSLTCATGACTSRDAQCQAYRSDSTGACSAFKGQCAMFCQVPIEGCVKVSGYFRQGSVCGNDGFCQADQTCSSADFVGGITQWILNNPTLSIALVIILALVIFFMANYCMKNMYANVDQKLIKEAKLEEDEEQRLKRIDKQRRNAMKTNRRNTERESEPAPSQEPNRGRRGSVTGGERKQSVVGERRPSVIDGRRPSVVGERRQSVSEKTRKTQVADPHSPANDSGDEIDN